MINRKMCKKVPCRVGGGRVVREILFVELTCELKPESWGGKKAILRQRRDSVQKVWGRTSWKTERPDKCDHRTMCPGRRQKPDITLQVRGFWANWAVWPQASYSTSLFLGGFCIQSWWDRAMSGGLAASKTLACSPPEVLHVLFTTPLTPSQQRQGSDALGVCDTEAWVFSSNTVQLCPHDNPLLPSLCPPRGESQGWHYCRNEFWIWDSLGPAGQGLQEGPWGEETLLTHAPGTPQDVPRLVWRASGTGWQDDECQTGKKSSKARG